MYGQSSGGGGGPPGGQAYGNANARMAGGPGPGYSYQGPHSQNKIDVDINRQCTYKEYLRDCFVYKDFKDLALAQYNISTLPEAFKPKCQLCQFKFQAAHECIFGNYCQFSHKIADVDELISEVENKKIKRG